MDVYLLIWFLTLHGVNTAMYFAVMRMAHGLPTEREGVGLASVCQVVEKYLGVMGYELKGECLVCKVAIGCA